jgi:hypothetical protein
VFVCSLSYTARKADVSSGCHFFALFHKWNDFREKFIEHKTVFSFSLQLLSEIFLVLRRVQRDLVINVHTVSCKVAVMLVRF